MLQLLLLQVVVITALARLLGWAIRCLRQPQVMGEMISGILLGPSLLGWIAPSLSQFLFPARSLVYLEALSQIGLVVFMFLVGLELDTTTLKRLGHTAVMTSHVSIAVPFFLGVRLSVFLYPRFSDNSVQFSAFGLFMGAAMRITAFPVLARILTDKNMLRSKVGSVAVACAAVDDVTAWFILAGIIITVRNAAGQAGVGNDYRRLGWLHSRDVVWPAPAVRPIAARTFTKKRFPAGPDGCGAISCPQFRVRD